MRWLIPILFFSLVYLEVYLFVAMANTIGVFCSLLAIVLFCVLGLAIVKKQGINNMEQMKQKLATGALPTEEVTKNYSILFAGIFFLFPGFFTDILGAILLIPFVQKQLIKRFVTYAKFNTKRYSSTTTGKYCNKITIEGEFSRKDTPSPDDKNIDK